jgi:O-antigen/teichoic acid export membrane protein
MQPPSLLKAALTAATWTLAGHGSSQVLRLLGNLLLTRVLAPESFGVMAVATVISVAFVMFSDMGLRQVLVQSRRAHDPEFVNTVWTLQILQGVLVASLMLLSAAGLAWGQHAGWVHPGSTYAHPDLPLLVAGLAFGSVLAGLESTRMASAEMDLQLRPVVMIELGSQAAGLATMCAAALAYPSIFVLLLGALAILGPSLRIRL